MVFGDRIEDDLARRDFTVNAMAVDLADGTLVDPYGGRADLADGVLRTPLEPEVSFSEDPLRMLRAARFHAGYDLTPTPELTTAITALLDRMDIVSVERIRDELQKLLLIDDPGPGLRLLAETGLLARVLPTLGDLSPADAEERGRLVGAVANDAAARWAALLAPEGIAASALGSMRFSGALGRHVVWFASDIDWASDPGSRAIDPPRIRRDAAMVPSDRELEELLDWVVALRTANGLVSDDVEAYRAAFRAQVLDEPDLADPAPLLSGETVCALLGIEPGREVGVAMKWLRELRLEEGPVDETVAADRLVAWWPIRGDDQG